VQLAASRQYLTRWTYGLALKFINSNYGIYRSSGIATDVGILYNDTVNLVSVGALARNMGFQLRSYGGTAEDLPFDLVIGATKRLKNSPLSFSLTADHAYQFDIRYADTAFDAALNGSSQSAGKKFTFDRIFRHFVLAMQIHVSDYIEVSMGYNHLRRQELNIGNGGNGLNGFSIGVGANLKKIQVRYARAYYENNTAYNQFGMNLPLRDYFSLGHFGEKIGW
jgi:hypothetical protein